jgi:CRP-like cAMP-binding protein
VELALRLHSRYQRLTSPPRRVNGSSMSLEQDIDLLSRVALLRGIPHEQLRLLAFGTERELLRSGKELFRIGDQTPGGYVVCGGQIDLVLYRAGREILLDSRREAESISEFGLITPIRQAFTALARTNSEVIFIPRVLFHRMLNTFPDTAALLHQRITVAFAAMLKQLEALQETIENAPRFDPARSS